MYSRIDIQTHCSHYIHTDHTLRAKGHIYMLRACDVAQEVHEYNK